jgi:hypothetical protein
LTGQLVQPQNMADVHWLEHLQARRIAVDIFT